MRFLIVLTLTLVALLSASMVLERVAAQRDPSRAPSGQASSQPALPHPAPSQASRHREPPSRLDMLDWHALALCESSNNPRAVNPTGKYRGLYQFDRETWESVGGTGDPAQASRAEQQYRALVLFTRRGREPWPSCGRRL